MPRIHVHTLRVRHYECDPNGHVNQANYLRYMQEAAFGASAAAGYDLARYEALDRLWLVRETDIEYLRPLRYGDAVQIKTWVSDFRRVRSRRAYELRHDGSGELVARASTDWVFLQLSTGRPVSIPPEMKTAFFPEGPPESAPRRKRFPAMSPPAGAFRQVRRVEWRDLDGAGHANNAVHLSYIEDCGLQAISARGWPLARLEAESVAVVARRHQIEYRQPALLDDELEVITWLSGVEDSTATRYTILTRPGDGAPISRARTLHVWLDLRTGKPTTIPRAFLAELAPGEMEEG